VFGYWAVHQCKRPAHLPASYLPSPYDWGAAWLGPDSLARVILRPRPYNPIPGQHNQEGDLPEPAHTPNPALPKCTELARTLGERPIGSAPTWTRCLVVELPAPWDPKVELSNAFPSELRELIQQLGSEGDRLRLQCVLPDPDYSAVGQTRLMLFSRPDGAFVTNDRVEYVVPTELVAQVAAGLLGDGADMAAFASFKEPDSPVRDILVCTHGNRDACCGTFGVPVYEALRQMAKSNVEREPTVRVWRTSHTGGHRFAPTLIDMPDGRYWAGVEVDLAGEILRRDGSVAAIASHYRGWAALDTCAEQNAEAAAFARVGWDWLTCEKQTETVSHDPALDRHTVRFDYAGAEGEDMRSFEVTVEFSGTVPTMNCMKDGSKGENSQYRVIAWPGG
jgi:hypothetical protein